MIGALFFEGRYKLTRTRLLYSDIVSVVLTDQRDEGRVKRELIRLRAEIDVFRRVVQYLSALHCLFGFSALKSDLIRQLVEVLERFRSIYFILQARGRLRTSTCLLGSRVERSLDECR